MTVLNEIGTIGAEFAKKEFEKHPFTLEGDQSLVLYGAGNLGVALYNAFQEENITVAFLLDKRAEELTYDSIPVVLPNSESSKAVTESSLVIISIIAPTDVLNGIRNEIKQFGYNHVYTLDEIELPPKGEDVYRRLLCSETIDYAQMKSAYQLLEDDKSRKVYTEFIKARLFLDSRYFSQPEPLEKQYLAHDIDIVHDYRNFVDCGAYDGDVIRTLLENKFQVEKLVAFEPQNELCTQISTLLDENSETFPNAMLYPCGVYSEICQLSFSTSENLPASSKIEVGGDSTIQCVSIDSVLKGFHPTFIKMDIEGAELAALKGAEKTIKEHLPQLAICVYHKFEDLWEIPLLIHEFSKQYKFYLRTYEKMGQETVLYAYPR